MAGNRTTCLAGAVTNKAKYGDDYYHRIGAKGGAKGRTGGFAYDDRTLWQKLLRKPKPDTLLARAAGRKGGSISKRTKKEL